MNEHSDRQWCLRIQHFASCHSSFMEKMVLDTANILTILSWGPGLWAREAWAISNSLPPGKQASKASQIDACLLTSISRKERGLVDSARMTYITRQASRRRKHPPVETNVLFQEDNVRPSSSHISNGYHSITTHVTAHIHQCQRGLLLFPTKKETAAAWQLSIMNFIFPFE